MDETIIINGRELKSANSKDYEFSVNFDNEKRDCILKLDNESFNISVYEKDIERFKKCFTKI